jgi:lambda family phage portal protein
VTIKPNLLERGLAAVGFARTAQRNFSARATMAGQIGFANYFVGQHSGARTDKTSLKNFNPLAGSADADSIGDLRTLRARSRDLGRNAPIARGARNTSKTNVVGAGLRLSARIERELLGMDEDAAEAWEAKAERLFHLWAKSKQADVTRTQNFYEMQALAFTSAWDSGDVFALRRYKEGTSFLALCVQMIEADRVCTPIDKQNLFYLRDGIELDEDLEPVAYHVLNRHPGDYLFVHPFDPQDWARIPARGTATNAPLMIHLFDRDRVDLTRGVPSLAPVIEALKQLDRYAEAELMAAVVSAFFTVFVKTTNPDGMGDGISLPQPGNQDHYGPAPLQDNEMALGSGTITELSPDEDISIANPNRPNANFDPFFLAVIRQIGIALGIPYEVLIMHFSSSYTASKAAIETARQFFEDRREWLARNFCQPVYEWFLFEAVTRGLIDAPGFFDDPVKRAAWCGSLWLGRAPIVLDAVKDATAAEQWIDLGVETVESVTRKTTGGNWVTNQEQRGRETALRSKLKIGPASPVDAAKAAKDQAAAEHPPGSEPGGGGSGRDGDGDGITDEGAKK